MVACTNITKLVLHGLLQIKQYCFIQGVLYAKMGSYVMGRSLNKVGLLHDTFQIGKRFVVFAINH